MVFTGSILRIVNVVQRFHPAVGGSENQVRLISRELVRRNHNVTVLTTSSMSSLDILSLTHLPKPRLRLPSREIIDGVEVHRYRALFRLYGFLLTSPMLKLLRVEADLIHAYGFYVTTSLAAGLAAKIRGIPFVITANDADVGLLASIWEKLCGKLYRMTFGKLLVSCADRVVAVSEANRDDIVGKLGVKPDKVVVAPNGLDFEIFEREANVPEFRKKHGVDGPLILFVGRITKHKGIQFLIEAAPSILKEFPTARFMIVGEDYGYLENLTKMVEKLGIGNHVIFLSGLSQDEIVQAYKSADIFVLPSTLEAFGLVVVEAMASGTPVVASNYGGIRCLVRDGVNGFLFEVENVPDLASKILVLLRNEELGKAFATKAVSQAKEQYSIQHTTDELLRVYAKLQDAG